MKTKAHRDGESGQGLVELALVAMLLMVIVLGLVDFGHVFHTYVVVTNAANVGATYASLSTAASNNLTKIQEAVLSETDAWGQLCLSTPSVTRGAATDLGGKVAVTVTVSCQVAHLIPMPDGFSEITVSASATRRVRS